jgi:hypothetical protein
MTGQGTISANDLMHKLVSAKKVMDKVETGSYEKGNVNEDILRSTPEEVVTNNKIPRSPIKIVDNNMNSDKINQSKLPDVIKKAMIENPIPQISLNDTIDMDLVKGAKKLMEREGMISKTPKKQITEQSQPERYVHTNSNFNDIITTLTPIIENTIRKVLDEKLNQILTAQQTSSINENLVLKVGDSIFKGKITGVNKSK